tara:strand:+ start:93 stop:377 length:285 start_codon:yes stop_codon:yes gene_type:complete
MENNDKNKRNGVHFLQSVFGCRIDWGIHLILVLTYGLPRRPSKNMPIPIVSVDHNDLNELDQDLEVAVFVIDLHVMDLIVAGERWGLIKFLNDS